jgi:membrane protein
MSHRAKRSRESQRVWPAPVGYSVGKVRLARDRRLTGLAAEVAFWATFTLPWILLGLLASLGAVERRFGLTAVETTRANLLKIANAVLPTSAVDGLVKPFVDSLLAGGRTDVTVIGLVVAFWSGSRTALSLVAALTLISGQPNSRGWLHTRALVLSLYAVFLIGVSITVPLIVVGPAWVQRRLSLSTWVSSGGYWALTVGATLVVVASLYHWSVPQRLPWRHDLPGAVVALAVWFGGSIGLRIYLAHLFRAGSVYGVAAAPIAIMLWVYVTAFAVLVGAILNVGWEDNGRIAGK